jgi:hypothetical protein
MDPKIKKQFIPASEVPIEEDGPLKQVNLGLHRTELANALWASYSKFNVRAQEAGIPTIGKGETSVRLLRLWSERFFKWVEGPLGIKDWDELTVEAKEAIFREKMREMIDTNMNELAEDWARELLEVAEPHIEAYLDSEAGQLKMQWIMEQHMKKEKDR